MVKEIVLFGCKREEYICFKKIIIWYRINEKLYINILYIKIKIIFFFFFYWLYMFVVFEKKVFYDMYSFDFLIIFYRNKFLKMFYFLKKNNF